MIDRLRTILGYSAVIDDPVEMSLWLTDWRGRKQGKALCVVFPSTTEQVAEVVRLAGANQQPIFPHGGNTGLCFGSVPESRDPEHLGIVLSLKRLNKIHDIDRVSNIATVEAGVILADLHTAALASDRHFPLHLGSEGTAQIGGLISTNAGGTGVLRYGSMRNLVAGLEVVLPDGRIFRDLSSLRKNNTGYLLRSLFVGAEGTLGVVTGASLYLQPVMRSGAHAWVSVPSPDAAVSLFSLFRERCGDSISAFEMVSGEQFSLVRRHIERARIPFEQIPAWSVLIELGSVDPVAELSETMRVTLEAGLEIGIVLDGFLAASESQASEIWLVRHSVSEANKRHGVGISLDICVRLKDVPAFVSAANEVSRIEFPNAVPLVVSHLGDGNVHFILMFQREFWSALADQDAFTHRIECAIHDVAAKFGGSFSAEHGIGRKLPHELRRLCDPLHYELMQAVRNLFDPQNLSNPGVLLDR